MKALKKTACGVALSIALAAGLCPHWALAQGSAATQADADTAPLIAAQAIGLEDDLAGKADLTAAPVGEAADTTLVAQDSSLNSEVLGLIEGWWNTWGQRPHPPLYRFHDGVADYYYSSASVPFDQPGDYHYTKTFVIQSITPISDDIGTGYDIDLGDTLHFRLYDGKPDLLYCFSGAKMTHSGTSSLERLSDELLEGDAPTITRLWGETALDTMAEIVNKGTFAENGIVVLATIDGYWDALTAAGIAGMAKAPVLMTNGSTLSPQTRTLIERLHPQVIVICGGPAAVSPSVAQEAQQAAGGNAAIERCAGNNAVGTANSVFSQAPGITGVPWDALSKGAFVCTSDGYWDALAAAPISYSQRMPIFLTDNAQSISQETIDAMKGNVSGVYIIGGTAAIGDSVVDQLRANGIEVYDRLWGERAVETSQAIANYFIAKFGLSANNLGVATVDGYWDALSGASLCGLNNSVLLLASDQYSSSIRAFAKDHAGEISNAFVFGGTAVITQATHDALLTWMKYGRSSKVADRLVRNASDQQRQRNVESAKSFMTYFYDRWDPPASGETGYGTEKGLGTCPVAYTDGSGVGERIASNGQYFTHFESVTASASGDNTVSYKVAFWNRLQFMPADGVFNVRYHEETGTLTFNEAGAITSWTYKVI